MTVWTIRAEYDPQSRTWYSADGDLPGLAADAATIEELAAKAGAMLPDLLEIHRDDIDPARFTGPHSIRIVAHYERNFDLAA